MGFSKMFQLHEEIMKRHCRCPNEYVLVYSLVGGWSLLFEYISMSRSDLFGVISLADVSPDTLNVNDEKAIGCLQTSTNTKLV